MRKDDWKQKGLEQGRLNEEVQQTKVGKNIPNGLKMYQMALCKMYQMALCKMYQRP
jgi:hypothetical protein